jgi:hypothetical protein
VPRLALPDAVHVEPDQGFVALVDALGVAALRALVGPESLAGAVPEEASKLELCVTAGIEPDRVEAVWRGAEEM